MSTALASPTYALSTWEGNVLDDHGVEWIVDSEQGWSSSPPIRPTSDDKSGADGSWSGPGFYGARVVELSGVAIAADRLSMLRAKDRIKAAVQPRTPMTLTVAEAHLTRIAQVRLSDAVEITDAGARAFRWSLAVSAADPRRYGASVVAQWTGLPATSTSGRTYPRTYPVLYGGSSSGGSGSVYIVQEGDYDQTPATVTFAGPVSSPQVAHAESGRSLTFAITLGDDETLAVDLGKRTAMLNGSASRISTITAASAWFMLAPGTNELQFRGQQESGSTTPLMTVTAQSAWT